MSYVHGLEKLILLKCSYYPKPSTYFTETEKAILKFIQNYKRLSIGKTMLRKKKADSITLPDLKLYCKVIVIKAVWHWHKNKYKPMGRNQEPRSRLIHT